MRVAAALILLLSLVPVSAADSAESFVSVKGFVISRSDHVLTVHNGGGTKVRVLLSSATVVRGARTTCEAIGVNDLIRAEGASSPDASIQAAAIDVVFAGESLALGSRRKANGSGNFLLNWIMNGKFSIDLP